MFRKKDTDSETPVSAESAFRRSGSETTKTGVQPDLRRKVEMPGSPSTTSVSVAEPGAPSAQIEPDRYGKRLIVGQGIRLSGEISSCDRLVVEGEVEVTLNDTLALEIASSGRFTGGCEVEEADISGVYEGDLTVRKHLCVRSTGRLTGTIRYSQLELERGGQIAGNISVINAEAGSGAHPSRTADRRSAPVFAEAGGSDEAARIA